MVCPRRKTPASRVGIDALRRSDERHSAFLLSGVRSSVIDPLGLPSSKELRGGAIAALIAIAVAIGLVAASVCAAGFLLRQFDGPDGPGVGALVILVAVNVAITAFTALFTFLVNLHRSTSWRTPTFAFVLCVGLARFMGPFDIQFVPFMLGTGAIAWGVCCWLLQGRRSTAASNVIKA
jgi:hypothetical protein